MQLSGMSRLWTFAAVLAMMGCTIHSRKDLQDIETQLKHAISENETCLAWLKESDVYQRLDRTFVLHDDDSYAATKTVIERNASANEKMDLLRLNNLAAVCRKHNLENFGQVHPDFIALLAKWYAEDDALLVELLRDRLTIGHANQIVYGRLPARHAESRAVGTTMTQQLETPSQAQKVDRQQAISALQQWSHEQQLVFQYRQRISPADTSRLTSCIYTGDDISCTLY